MTGKLRTLAGNVLKNRKMSSAHTSDPQSLTDQIRNDCQSFFFLPSAICLNSPHYVLSWQQHALTSPLLCEASSKWRFVLQTIAHGEQSAEERDKRGILYEFFWHLSSFKSSQKIFFGLSNIPKSAFCKNIGIHSLPGHLDSQQSLVYVLIEEQGICLEQKLPALASSFKRSLLKAIKRSCAL